MPSIDELPYLNFKNPTHDEIHNILNSVYDVGSIVKLGPVKITDVQEKPGCIYVKWNIDDPDYANDEYIYLLQKANGEIFDQTSEEFITVYEGTDNYCFINDLQFNKVITLRVGIQSFETAWSAPRIAKTNITSYGIYNYYFNLIIYLFFIQYFLSFLLFFVKQINNFNSGYRLH